MEPIVKELIEFIAAAPTAFHAVAKAAELLGAEGFVPLAESERWQLARGAGTADAPAGKAGWKGLAGAHCRAGLSTIPR